jgi:hypothetical protein
MLSRQEFDEKFAMLAGDALSRTEIHDWLRRLWDPLTASDVTALITPAAGRITSTQGRSHPA